MSNVSVILPVYNEEKLVSKAIESVPKDVELIVINDGSTDNTLQVLKKYDNIKLISYAKNRGVAHALNKGLDKATGDYIVLLSADDFFYTYNFIVATQKLDGTDIIFFQATTNYGLIDLDIGNTRAGSFKFVRREFLGDLRNEEQRLAGEDYNLWQKLLAKNPSIKYLDLIVKHYNYPREGSLNWQLNNGLIDLESGQRK